MERSGIAKITQKDIFIFMKLTKKVEIDRLLLK